MKISDAKKIFMDEQTLRGNSPRTSEIYDLYINYFIDYLGDLNIKDVTRQSIKDYTLYLLDRNINPNKYTKKLATKKLSRYTIKTYVSHLKTFFIWLYNENYKDENIFINYKFPKLPKQIKPILSDSDVVLLLSNVNDSNYLGSRNYCIILLMLDSGLRVQEVPALNIEDFNIINNSLFIKDSKGGRDRIVPVSIFTSAALQKYLKFRRLINNDNALFLDLKRNRITTSAIKSYMFRLKRKLNIDKLNPHLLRHTFATKFIINGGDIVNLQLIMGHSDLDTTRKYVQLARYYQDIKFDNFSVVSNLKKPK